MFGADDADWAIYRKIVRTPHLLFFSHHSLVHLLFPLSQNTAAPSSDEEEDMAQLQIIEQKLLAYDPTFTNKHTHASIASQRSALMSAFRPSYEEGDIEGICLPSRQCEEFVSLIS